MHSIRALASAAGLVLAAIPALGQNLLENSSFETPPAGSSFVNRGGDGLTGWLISGNLDHIGGLWAAADGAQSLDLNGSSAATITQTVATVPGGHYRLRYALSENFFGFADKTMEIAWEGNVVASVTVAHDPERTIQDMRWEQREMLVTATSTSATLAFISTTGAMDGSQGVAAFYGPALDDVRLEAAPCAADFNADDFVNPDDLSDFITCFFLQVQFPATCPAADFNADGFINPDDLSDFITTFFLAVQFGC